MYHRRPSLDRETGTDIYSLSVVTMYLQGEESNRMETASGNYCITVLPISGGSLDGYSWPLRPFPSSGVSIRSGGVLYRGEGFHTLRGNFRLYYLHPFGIRIKEETASGIIVLPYYRFRAVLSMGDRETRPPSHRREEIRPRPERIERERDRGYSIPFGCIFRPTRERRE